MNFSHFICANKRQYEELIYHVISFFREMWVISIMHGTQYSCINILKWFCRSKAISSSCLLIASPEVIAAMGQSMLYIQEEYSFKAEDIFFLVTYEGQPLNVSEDFEVSYLVLILCLFN